MAGRPRTVLVGMYFDGLLAKWKQRAARIADLEAENVTLRAHIVALVRCLHWICNAPTMRDSAEYAWSREARDLVNSPDLTALVERERMRDAVIEAARLSAPTGAPPWDVQKNLRQALATLDAPKPLEKENE